jgi:hypothetical protein
VKEDELATNGSGGANRAGATSANLPKIRNIDDLIRSLRSHFRINKIIRYCNYDSEIIKIAKVCEGVRSTWGKLVS